jgi:hypothetical protein
MIASIAKSGEGVKLGAVDPASLDLAMLDSRPRRFERWEIRAGIASFGGAAGRRHFWR